MTVAPLSKHPLTGIQVASTVKISIVACSTLRRCPLTPSNLDTLISIARLGSRAGCCKDCCAASVGLKLAGFGKWLRYHGGSRGSQMRGRKRWVMC